MGKIEKPVTEQMKERCNELYRVIRDGRTVTKDEVCAICKVKSERQARDIISTLAGRVPIIATSDGRGYRIARTASDIDEVRHTWQELDSRQAELERRKKPLIAFYEKKMGGNN